MSYAELASEMFLGYLLAGLFAYLVTVGVARLQVTAFVAFIALFQMFLAGHAQHFHFWWYLLNAGVYAILAMVSMALWYVFTTRSSYWVAWLSWAAVATNTVYFFCAWAGHRLPGQYYFSGISALEIMQVSVLLIFSNPGLWLIDRASRYIPHRRTRTWIQHKELMRA